MYDKVLVSAVSSQYDRTFQHRLAYGLARPVACHPSIATYLNYQVLLGTLLKPSGAMVAYGVLGGLRDGGRFKRGGLPRLSGG